MKGIAVSVIMPVYNGERYISKSIQSVLNQTYKNFELIIYNDGSTDNTIELVNSIKDPRIRIIDSNLNKGIVYALNYMINISKGDFIARIDSDDVWYPRKLEQQIKYLNKNPSCLLVGCFARLIDDSGKEYKTKFKQYSNWEDIKIYLPNSNFIIHSSVLMRKELFIKIGKYSEKYLYTEDYELWLRMLSKKLSFSILPKKMLDYRVSKYSINFRFRKKQSSNVIKLKINYWRRNGFKIFYLKEMTRNIYYLLFPYWVLKFKKIINKL